MLFWRDIVEYLYLIFDMIILNNSVEVLFYNVGKIGEIVIWFYYFELRKLNFILDC